MCVLSSNLLGLTVPEKNVTEIFNVWKLERKENEELKEWISTNSLISYTQYSHPLFMFVRSFNLLGLMVPNKTPTKKIMHDNCRERKLKTTTKGQIRAAAWFRYTRYILLLFTCVPSFIHLGLTVPEKNVTKTFKVWKLEEEKWKKKKK